MARYLLRIINSFDQHSKSPILYENPKGLSGMYNLGNTCYFNSVLQCLSHCKIIQEFSYTIPTPSSKNSKPGDKQIYNENIALTFFSLVKSIWSGEYSVVTPKAIRNLLCDKYDQFKGFAQQDAQELLLILLDELNISLTQTSLKEMIVNEEIKNIIQPSPSEKADEIWKQYLTANNSIITHSFSGQQQQKIICSECGHYSVSYDPFNCISLTIPSLKRQKGFVPCAIVGLHGEPIVCKILVSISPTIDEVKQEIRKVLYQLQKSENIQIPHDIDINIDKLCFVVECKKSNSNHTNPSQQKKKYYIDGKLNLINYERIIAYECESLDFFKTQIQSKQSLQNSKDQSKEIKESTKDIIVLIYLREIKSSEAILLHNVPILLQIDSSMTIQQLKELIHKRLQWITTSSYSLHIVDETGKSCKLCGEKLQCTGCLLKDEMIINDLKNKQNHLYISYECDTIEEMKKQITCESFYISNNQRLQTTAVSLFGCLTLFTHGDSFDQIDWNCEKCEKNVKADVDITIWRPPKVLIFHLKRFEFTEKYERIKTNEPIVVPPQRFDLKEYIDNETITESVYYNLFAIINHSGEIDHGHYFADCLCHKTWYRFNDEKVTPLEQQPTTSEEAYLLFYTMV